MSPYETAVAAAVKLPLAQREQLAQALGLKLQPSTPAATLPMVSNFAGSASRQIDPQAWRKAESGHAVLANDENLRDDEIPTGAAAISGIWSARAAQLLNESTPGAISVADLRAFSPVVVHYDVALALACGEESAANFFNAPSVEIRLATAGYLALLSACETSNQQQRVRRFVQPFAVLSLGPMASSRAVELMLEYSQQTGLAPLDALTAATAIAHEIPLVARDASRFEGISGLMVCGV